MQQLAERIRSDKAFATQIASRPEACALLAYASELRPPAAAPDPAAAPADDEKLGQPLPWQYRVYFLQFLPPFIGFGFIDNFIMLLAGDYIDCNLGMTLGLSTLAAAGIGNTFSDVAGLWVSGVVESFVANLGIPDHGLTFAQRSLLHVRILKNVSMILGTVVGCVLGMCPLYWPRDWRLWPPRPDPEFGHLWED